MFVEVILKATLFDYSLVSSKPCIHTFTFVISYTILASKLQIYEIGINLFLLNSIPTSLILLARFFSGMVLCWSIFLANAPVEQVVQWLSLDIVSQQTCVR